MYIINKITALVAMQRRLMSHWPVTYIYKYIYMSQLDFVMLLLIKAAFI